MTRKIWKVIGFLLVALGLCVSPSLAESDQFKQFKHDYDILHQDLLNHGGEVVQIKDFVYTKDIATFTFHDGTIHFQRYVNGRPTTAIFVGTGHVRIEVPSHVERQSLLTMSGDSVVDASFTTCFILTGDDFDLKVRKQFQCREEKLHWADFNTGSKQTQGEFFFKPVVFHRYDNYFQLLRSAYERQEDGYFWISFNRYVFTFDPNRPEEVTVAYQLEGGDIVPADAAVMQRKEHDVYEDSAMSRITYATSVLSKQGQFEMGGANGHHIEKGEGHLRQVVNADSLRFLSLFLDKHLTIDSIKCNGNPVDFMRRKDFWFTGIVLPHSVVRGDTLDVGLWYHGVDYAISFPAAEDPRAVPHSLKLVSDRGINYLASDSGTLKPLDKGKQEVTFASARPYSKYLFGSFVTGYDTISFVSASGQPLRFIRLNVLQDKYFAMDTTYTLGGLNVLSSLLGPPNGGSPVVVSYYSRQEDLPGIITGPISQCDDFIGGYYHAYGQAVSRQWFPTATAGFTHRESWLADALSEYLALMIVQEKVGPEAFYRNLLERRNVLYTIGDRGHDLPLASGSSTAQAPRINKGVWLIHMLRWLLYDLENQTEDHFTAFLKDVSSQMTRPGFSNHSFEILAEKHYGGSLQAFFQYWLYGTGMPRYEVAYNVEQRGDRYFVNAEVSNHCEQSPCLMPVIVRIAEVERTTFVRQVIRGPHDSFSLGPFETRPTEFHFNEFFSVLSRDEVHEK